MSAMVNGQCFSGTSIFNPKQPSNMKHETVDSEEQGTDDSHKKFEFYPAHDLVLQLCRDHLIADTVAGMQDKINSPGSSHQKINYAR